MNYDYKNLRPFKWFVLQNFPFIEADFDAITNWQLFCKLGEEINKLINSENLTGQQVEDLTNAFNSLQSYVNNYFDNLDIQEEVNEKLDEMAEGGELAEIISQYLQTQAIIGFNTNANLKSANNLANGSFARTYGKNTYNDGKGAFYKIRETINTDVPDDDNIIALTNYPTLIAEKMPETKIFINVKDYGAYGDGVHDDITAIQNCINQFPHKTIYFPEGTYLISSPIIIKSGNEFQVNLKLDSNATIKSNSQIESLIEIGKNIEGTYDRYSAYGKNLISGGVLDCSNATYGIFIDSNRKFTTIENLSMINVANFGIYTDRGENTSISSDCRILNVSISGVGSDITGSTGIYLYGTDNELNEIRLQKLKKGIVTFGGDLISNVHITGDYSTNNVTANNYNDSIGIELNGSSFFNNIYVDTMGISILMNAGGAVFNCNNFYTFYWKKDSSFETIIFKFKNLGYVRISNCELDLPDVGIVKGVDISEISETRDRANFIYRKSMIIKNLLIKNPHMLNQFDKLNTYQIQENLNNIIDTFPAPWTLRMNQNQYYKLCGLKEGLYKLIITNNEDQQVQAIINANSNGSIQITNLINNSHVNEYSLHLLNPTSIDNINYYTLALKSNNTSCFYSPTIYIQDIFTNEIFNITRPDIPIENPTIVASANFN